MDLLEGAAAFAVVMIVFSTIVTGIVEGILRLTATRQAVLARAGGSDDFEALEARLTALRAAAAEIVDRLLP